MTDADEDFAPEMPVAFDDDGNAVLVSHPIYDPQAADAADDPRGEFQEKLARFLEWLCSDNDFKTAGRKAMLLAHFSHKTKFKTDAALAAALNISAGRVSQIRREIGAFLPSLARCNRRQIKARRTIE